jgi:hypothetical protein
MVYIYFSIVSILHPCPNFNTWTCDDATILVDDICTFDIFSSLVTSYYGYKTDTSINIGT